MQTALSVARRIFAACLAAALLFPIAPQAFAAKLELSVSARVLTSVRLRSVSHPLLIVVGAATHRDAAPVSRSSTELEVFSNTGMFALHIDIVDAEVTAVEIEGLDEATRVLPGGTTVQVRVSPAERNVSRRTLSYRIRYAEGVAPGPRPNPVRLFVQNV